MFARAGACALWNEHRMWMSARDSRPQEHSRAFPFVGHSLLHAQTCTHLAASCSCYVHSHPNSETCIHASHKELPNNKPDKKDGDRQRRSELLYLKTKARGATHVGVAGMESAADPCWLFGWCSFLMAVWACGIQHKSAFWLWKAKCMNDHFVAGAVKSAQDTLPHQAAQVWKIKRRVASEKSSIHLIAKPDSRRYVWETHGWQNIKNALAMLLQDILTQPCAYNHMHHGGGHTHLFWHRLPALGRFECLPARKLSRVGLPARHTAGCSWRCRLAAAGVLCVLCVAASDETC
jgi:hypothetical protein